MADIGNKQVFVEVCSCYQVKHMFVICERFIV